VVGAGRAQALPSTPSAAEGAAVGAAPGAPPSAKAIFGPALGLATRYADLLAGPGVERGLLGPHEVARLWDRHLLNCAAVAELVPRPSSVVDVGSGAGLPGIILAMLLPDVKVVLLEPMARRAAFLEECVRVLGLSNAVTSRRRAEEAVGELVADVVTARAVAPLDRLAGLTLPLVRPGGMVLALKGASAQREVEQARPALRKAGVQEVAVIRAGVGRVIPPAIVVRITARTTKPRRPWQRRDRVGARQTAGRQRS
jgi:16S rRNA (guanine527-N7)-methyltransferase